MRLDTQQKTRLKKLLTTILIILAIGLIYLVIIKILGQGIPCPIRLVTHRFCPGCGISRMFVALAFGDFQTAVRYNLLLMCCLPFAAVFGARHLWRYIKSGNNDLDKIEIALIGIAFVLMIAFWIMRNTEAFSFLAPIE